jgi:hypothetical protein
MIWRDGSFDHIRIDGVRPPGRVSRFDVTISRDVKQTKTPNTDTPHIKDQGYSGADIDLEIELFREAQYVVMRQLLADWSPRQPGATAKPLVIEHPLATLHNIAGVYIKEIRTSIPRRPGGLTIKIKMAEWFSPEQVKPTSQNNTPPVAPGAGNGAIDDDGGGIGVPPPNPGQVGATFT